MVKVKVKLDKLAQSTQSYDHIFFVVSFYIRYTLQQSKMLHKQKSPLKPTGVKVKMECNRLNPCRIKKFSVNESRYGRTSSS